MFDNWYHSIHNLESHSFKGLYCYIPVDSSEELKRDLKAVLAKNQMGYTSIDYVKKRQEKIVIPPTKKNPYLLLLNDLLETCWKSISETNRELDEIILEKETIITLTITSNFARLKNSYESILFLIRNQFFFESNAINRLIFEQINYNFNVAQFTPYEYENLFKNQIKKAISPTNINKLKRFLPKQEISRFYSILSDLAHIGINSTDEYLSYEDEIKDYVITMKSISQSITSAIYLLFNIDLHRIVFEYCFADNSNISLNSTVKTNDTFIVNPNRQLVKKYTKFVDRFNLLLKEVEIEAHINMKRQIIDDEDNLPF